MNSFLPYMTNDFSVGLYDDNVNDIYHSAFGALTEAFEKFVNPAVELLGTQNNIKVLDICYGIGYNTKALLSHLFGSDVRADIDCVDIDGTLIELSPFIKTKISLFDRLFSRKKLYKNIIDYDEAKKIINLENEIKIKYKISNKINFILLLNLVEKFGFDFLSDESKNLMLKNENRLFFDKDVVDFYKFLTKKGVYLYQNENKSAFVHNIYYRNISKRINNIKKSLNFDRYNINFYKNDIRRFVLGTSNVYNLIFLDGFTPAKCPCIWSYEFINKLYGRLSDSGVIVTYNMSAAVRNAFKLSGFYIGDIYDSNNKRAGTIAAKNFALIKNNLSDRQEGLLNTKAGIPYRDKDLMCQNEVILSARKLEMEQSNLISASQYLKDKG